MDKVQKIVSSKDMNEAEKLKQLQELDNQIREDIKNACEYGLPEVYSREQLMAPMMSRIAPIIYWALDEAGQNMVKKCHDYFDQVNSQWESFKNAKLKDRLTKGEKPVGMSDKDWNDAFRGELK